MVVTIFYIGSYHILLRETLTIHILLRESLAIRNPVMETTKVKLHKVIIKSDFKITIPAIIRTIKPPSSNSNIITDIQILSFC